VHLNKQNFYSIQKLKKNTKFLIQNFFFKNIDKT